MKKVYIVGGNRQYTEMWVENGFMLEPEPFKADVVQFTGGEDVTPALYGQDRHPHTHNNPARDEMELKIFSECLLRGIPMVGICRGGQFLNVASGGSMWQHIGGHAVGGTHKARDERSLRVYQVSSTHHQMMIPASNAVLVGTAHCSTFKEDHHGNIPGNDPLSTPDVEVVWYPQTRSLCFQPHPEFFDPTHPCQIWYYSLIKELIGL